MGGREIPRAVMGRRGLGAGDGKALRRGPLGGGRVGWVVAA